MIQVKDSVYTVYCINLVVSLMNCYLHVWIEKSSPIWSNQTVFWKYVLCHICLFNRYRYWVDIHIDGNFWWNIVNMFNVIGSWSGNIIKFSTQAHLPKYILLIIMTPAHEPTTDINVCDIISVTRYTNSLYLLISTSIKNFKHEVYYVRRKIKEPMP